MSEQELIIEIKNELNNKKMKLATAESASCGYLANLIGSIPGISSIYNGGVIVYSELAKNKILKISKKLLNKYGTISKECVEKMVTKTSKILNATNVIVISGNAGPSQIENKDIGCFYCGIMVDGRTTVDLVEIDKKLNRNEMRSKIVEYCLIKMIDELKKLK
ncbi:MAG: nicotinamide-nucleotide amidohydrolase family protein [Ureaplasma sp.]|nr:nicotinamide-nucleotide amidohydrolase family protein [Ureaplasma sp.]MDE7222073.1 nicotinamide-nucleotide amidohydrolase family protein [Ureaplasma sp.]